MEFVYYQENYSKLSRFSLIKKKRNPHNSIDKIHKVKEQKRLQILQRKLFSSNNFVRRKPSDREFNFNLNLVKFI